MMFEFSGGRICAHFSVEQLWDIDAGREGLAGNVCSGSCRKLDVVEVRTSEVLPVQNHQAMSV